LETDEAVAIRQEMGTSQDSAGPSETAGQSATSGEPGARDAARGSEPSRRDQASWVDEKLESILESLLFVAGEPVSLSQLANALEEVPRERIRKTLTEMAADYASSGRGFVLEEIAGGYQLRTPTEHAVYVRRLLSAKPPRLSRPLLETLAIVAYRQPVTRPEIEQLRGVDSGGVLDTLIERNLIRIAGRKDAPGRPMMYTTTLDFLELFGLKDLESLPDLEEFRELEGLHERVEASQPAPPADSGEDATSPGGSEPRPQSRSNEPISEPPIVQADQILHETGRASTTPSEDPGTATADESTTTVNEDESENRR
jgi:segregation and condensation protein B